MELGEANQSKIRLTTVFGDNTEVGVYTNVKLEFEYFATTIDLYVAPSIKDDILLLGMNWAATYQATVN
ncbi:hypothetical protein BB560_001811 [Smittium megazygosporum]|uniref:Uncharacterized protein n=1 Tax=Smittium megazygosporum TaxID=133381 RepID=A0A2T9ZGI7_9FUNG|nr:hypothetical protein BB560_001811 [Smittium megazygosporum]